MDSNMEENNARQTIEEVTEPQGLIRYSDDQNEDLDGSLVALPNEVGNEEVELENPPTHPIEAENLDRQDENNEEAGRCRLVLSNRNKTTDNSGTGGTKPPIIQPHMTGRKPRSANGRTQKKT